MILKFWDCSWSCWTTNWNAGLCYFQHSIQLAISLCFCDARSITLILQTSPNLSTSHLPAAVPVLDSTPTLLQGVTCQYCFSLFSAILVWTQTIHWISGRKNSWVPGWDTRVGQLQLCAAQGQQVSSRAQPPPAQGSGHWVLTPGSQFKSPGPQPTSCQRISGLAAQPFLPPELTRWCG